MTQKTVKTFTNEIYGKTPKKNYYHKKTDFYQKIITIKRVSFFRVLNTYKVVRAWYSRVVGCLRPRETSQLRETSEPPTAS